MNIKLRLIKLKSRKLNISVMITKICAEIKARTRDFRKRIKEGQG